MIYFNEITNDMRDVPDFLPMSRGELRASAPEANAPDFVIVTGDAYVDHPSFGVAIIGKLLWAKGYTVGVIARPNMQKGNVFAAFGCPRLAFLVTSGSVDSMVNNYTAALKRRAVDVYAPKGKSGLRPDYAVSAYSRAIREAFGDVPIVLGGLEASLRRLSHYDYWSDKVMPSVLLSSGADIAVYGMGERQILAIADALAAGVSVKDINYIEGTVWKTRNGAELPGTTALPDYTEVCASKTAYAKSYKIQYENTVWQQSQTLSEKYSEETVVQNPPSVPLTRAELDRVYGIKFARMPHPSYNDSIPSIQEVKFSIISSRGCFGACAFCALAFHQGRDVGSRSHESILREAEEITRLEGFKGYIHDVGGPTANFRRPSCEKSAQKGHCTHRRCLTPKPCPNLDISHADYLELLRKLRQVPGVKKVFIRSGIRYDYVMHDNNGAFLRELVEHHVSGQLKVAPEHVSADVLRLMGKPSADIFDSFSEKYARINEKLGKKQFLVPYLMSGHPGSGLKDAVALAEYLRDRKLSPEQVQDFYPTPGTVATCMYYTGIDPLTGEKVKTARTRREKAMQRALIQYKNPKNRRLVIEALKLAGREDLIGYGPKCLVKPFKF